MIWKASVMCACISWEECSHGKDSRPITNVTNMRELKRKNLQPQLKFSVKDTLWNSPSIWVHAETSDSMRDPITLKWEPCSRNSLTRADTSMTINTIGSSLLRRKKSLTRKKRRTKNKTQTYDFRNPPIILLDFFNLFFLSIWFVNLT